MKHVMKKIINTYFIHLNHLFNLRTDRTSSSTFSSISSSISFSTSFSTSFRTSVSNSPFFNSSSQYHFSILFSLITIIAYFSGNVAQGFFTSHEEIKQTPVATTKGGSLLGSTSAQGSANTRSQITNGLLPKEDKKTDHLSLFNQNLNVLNAARAEYEKMNLENAISLYEKIEKNSDFWLEALEEKSWAYTRQKNYEKALGELHSLEADFFAPQVGPETYVLSAFVSLKTCDYKSVIEKIELFKKRMIPRVKALEKWKNRPEMTPILYQLSNHTTSLAQLGLEAENYPRFFHRDQILLSLLKENSTGPSKSMNPFVGNPIFSPSKQAKIFQRLNFLAKQDLEEIEKNLKKMKVIEIDLTQRIAPETLSLNAKKQTPKEMIDQKDLKFSKIDSNKQILFRAEDKEIWLDEVSHVEVKSDSCPEKIIKTRRGSI